MKKSIRLLPIFCMLFFATNVTCESIKIATIDWCPLICPNDAEKPGLLVEYTKAIFDRQGYHIKFTCYPWSRAINVTLKGDVDAVLAPAKSEAPELIYPESNIGVQRFCFFVRKEDTWKYQTPDSIIGRNIIHPQDALPTELFAVKHKAARIDARSYNDKYMDGTTKQLQAKRYDSILMTYYSMIDFLQKNNLSDHIKFAGCVSSQNLYLAFSPHSQKQEFAKRLIDIFEREIKELQKNNYFENLLIKYNLD